ncbi:MAG: hypothetical protein JRC60_00505 [Deltaproteobacteria bacterium]|nr:hypothetical protein [Deltaproteobacteria bacterium]
MRAVNKKAKAVLDILTENPRVFDNGGPGIMAVHVEKLCILNGGTVYSVAHYYKQNGDMMRDPDIEFLKGRDGNYYPLSYRQDGLGIFHEVAVYDSAGQLKGYRPRMQKDIAIFAGTWMKNIREQQGLS